MNEDTLIIVCCYAGDGDRVRRAMPIHQQHQTDLLVLSPADSFVDIEGVSCRGLGRAAYIGQASLDRQRLHMQAALNFGHHKFFLFHDADSICLSPELPQQLFEDTDTVWANLVVEPRPHGSPYPKLAAHPPIFTSRHCVERMLAVAPSVLAHRITPYIDWWWIALASEAGLTLRRFSDLETGPEEADGYYRIRRSNRIFLHPVKSAEQLELCQEAYANRG